MCRLGHGCKRVLEHTSTESGHAGKKYMKARVFNTRVYCT